MNQLYESLYVISTGLLIPVIVGLFLALALTVVQLGEATSEWLSRRRAGRAIRNPAESSVDALVRSAGEAGRTSVFLARFLREVERGHLDRLGLEKVLDDTDIEVNRRLSRHAFYTRVGPMLGLMGTLIPLGPSLIALSSGNMGGMARNLVVAFTTTVVGLVVGSVAYLTLTLKRSWYAQDLSDISFLLERLAPTEEKGTRDEDSCLVA